MRNNTNRRDVLRKLGIGAAALTGGSVGIPSQVVVADHDGYKTKETFHDEDTESGCIGELYLSSGTSLGYVDSHETTNHWKHEFYFSTVSGAEYPDREQSTEDFDSGISYHSFEIDGSDGEFFSDIFQARTGITNSVEGAEEVTENVTSLASSAISLAAVPLVSTGLDVLEGALALYDLYENDNESIYVRGREYDRGKNYDLFPHRAKDQGHFTVEVPKGEGDYVKFEATTRARELIPSWFCGDPHTYPATVSTTNTFYIFCYDDNVSIYSRKW